MSLISKITEKLKNPTNGKILRKGVASVALASALALSGCSGLASIFNPNNGQTNNPNIDNDNQTQIGGDGSATTPEEDDDSYSQIISNIMENEYYKTLMNNYISSADNRDSQIYDPIPYAFLQSEGYNIERIKNDEIECNSMPYMKDGEENNLYIALRVETDAQTPYYTCYTLKYELTNLQMSEFLNLNRHEYYDAPLFVQELSYQKTPVVESEASIKIDTFDYIVRSFANSKSCPAQELFGTTDITMELLSFSEQNNTLVCQMRKKRSSEVVDDTVIRTAYLVPGFPGWEVSSIYNNVYSFPKSVTFATDKERSIYMNEPINVTYYDTQNKYLTNYFIYDYEL